MSKDITYAERERDGERERPKEIVTQTDRYIVGVKEQTTRV